MNKKIYVVKHQTFVRSLSALFFEFPFMTLFFFCDAKSSCVAAEMKRNLIKISRPVLFYRFSLNHDSVGDLACIRQYL